MYIDVVAEELAEEAALVGVGDGVAGQVCALGRGVPHTGARPAADVHVAEVAEGRLLPAACFRQNAKKF